VPNAPLPTSFFGMPFLLARLADRADEHNEEDRT
jgi:hypothetical protein